MIVGKLASDGSLLYSWGVNCEYEQAGNALVENDEGNLIIIGIMSLIVTPTEQDFFILQLEPITGTIVTMKMVSGIGVESVTSIVQLSNGDYLVTGTTSSYGAGGTDIFVARFGSTLTPCGDFLIQEIQGALAYDLALQTSTSSQHITFTTPIPNKSTSLPTEASPVVSTSRANDDICSIYESNEIAEYASQADNECGCSEKGLCNLGTGDCECE